MNWFESLILGLVQGLTEFSRSPPAPICVSRRPSRAGRTRAPRSRLVTQIGTGTAVLIYFRKDISRILSAWFRSLTDKSMRADQDARLGWLVIVGSVPIGVLGVTLKDQIEGPFRDLRLTATMLIVLGVVLGVADRLAARAQEGGRHRAAAPRKTLADLGVEDGLVFGLCRAMALVPGVSVRRDDQRRPVHEPHPRVRRPVLLPPRHPRRHGVRGVQS